MSYPKFLYSKSDLVLVKSKEQEKELGDGYFDSPVKAKADYPYEGKEELEKASKKSKEPKHKEGDKA